MAILQKFRKCIRDVLAASVAVKGQLCGIAAFRISFPESGYDKPGAGGVGYTIPHDPTGRQVDDGAKIDSGIVDFKIGDIADSYLVGRSAVKCRCSRFRFLSCCNFI